jgi:hypothetical protein
MNLSFLEEEEFLSSEVPNTSRYYTYLPHLRCELMMIY